MLAIQNKPDEQNPWPTIIKIAPFNPHLDKVRIPLATIDIWATEDKAIRSLISVCRRQIRLTTTPPIKAHLTKAQFELKSGKFNLGDRRISPYPPNFSNTPANIIDPATGASTWALGNQRWTM